MKAEEFYKQRSNSIRELWALSPKQIEYIGLIMEEYAALRQPLVVGRSEQCTHEYKVDDKSDIPFDLICQKCGKTA